MMQISMSNYRSTESSNRNLEIQVGQLAKQMAERPTGNFRANTEKNPKKECRAVLTRSQMRVQGEAEKAEGDQSEEGRADKEEEKEEEEEKREEEVEKKVLTSKTKS